ncbi:MAG: hypothetical protein K2F59_05860 [Eubacteriales bacterium]|nr:hypothetical protein [Eubacteriales bacterium]
MKTEIAINGFKKELKKLQKKISNRTALFIIVGVVIALVSIVFLVFKIKNKIELLCEDDDFYYDEDDDFYEDYHALDYEEEYEE